MSEQTVLSEVDERGFARITLNRPDMQNAMNEVLIGALVDAFERVAGDPAVRVVVLAGNGQSFCSGGDLNWMRRTAEYGIEENVADARVLAKMLDSIYRCPKPVVGLIHGNVYGGGNGLVCAVDIACKLGLWFAIYIWCCADIAAQLYPPKGWHKTTKRPRFHRRIENLICRLEAEFEAGRLLRSLGDRRQGDLAVSRGAQVHDG